MCMVSSTQRHISPSLAVDPSDATESHSRGTAVVCHKSAAQSFPCCCKLRLPLLQSCHSPGPPLSTQIHGYQYSYGFRYLRVFELFCLSSVMRDWGIKDHMYSVHRFCKRVCVCLVRLKCVWRWKRERDGERERWRKVESNPTCLWIQIEYVLIHVLHV